LKLGVRNRDRIVSERLRPLPGGFADVTEKSVAPPQKHRPPGKPTPQYMLCVPIDEPGAYPL
jgi:hypothetical protein